MGKKIKLDLLVKAIWEGKDLQKGESSLQRFGRLGKAAFGGAAAALAAFGVESVKTFTKFEKQLNEVFTLLPQLSGEAMHDMKDDVLDLSQELGMLATDVVPALYQAVSAGQTEDPLGFMRVAADAARGGVTDLKTAVDGITSVINAYGEEVISATEASDKMFTAVKLGKTTFPELSKFIFQVTPMAAALGVNFGDVAAALAALTAQGVKTRVATTQVRQLLIELSREGAKANEVFREISGVAFKEFIANGGNLQTALVLMKKHADDFNLGVNDMFSTIEAGNAALALTSDAGAAKFAHAMGEMNSSMGATAEASARMKESFSFNIEQFETATQRLKILVGEGLVPGSRALVDFGTETATLAGDLLVLNDRINDLTLSMEEMAMQTVPQQEESVSKLINTWMSFDGFFEQALGRNRIVGPMREALAATIDWNQGLEGIRAQLQALNPAFVVHNDGMIRLDGTIIGVVQGMQEMAETLPTVEERQAAVTLAFLNGEEGATRMAGGMGRGAKAASETEERLHMVDRAAQAAHSGFITAAGGADNLTGSLAPLYDRQKEVAEQLAFNAALSRDYEEASLDYEVTAEQVAEKEKARAEAHAAAAEAMRKAEEVQANLFNSIIGGNQDLNIYNEELDTLGTRLVSVGGFTQDQRRTQAELTSELQRAQDQIFSLTHGVDGLGLSEEERNEKLATAHERIAQVTAAQAALGEATYQQVEVTTEATLNQDALNQAMLESAQEAGASAAEIAILGGALGIYTDEAVEAALKSALMQQEIDRLTQMYADNDLTLDGLIQGVQDYTNQLDTEFAAAMDKAQTETGQQTEALANAGSEAETTAEKTTNLIELYGLIPDAVSTTITAPGLDSLIGKVSSLAGQIANLAQNANNVAAALPGGGPAIRALGGPVQMGTPYIVGEHGPELFIPQQSGRVVNNTAMRGSEAGHKEMVTINIVQRPGENAMVLANRIVDTLGARTR